MKLKEIEEVVLDEKDKNVLSDVTFVPPKFGAYTLSCMLLGVGLGLMLNGNYVFGTVKVLIGLLAMAYFFSKRGKW